MPRKIIKKRVDDEAEQANEVSLEDVILEEGKEIVTIEAKRENEAKREGGVSDEKFDTMFEDCKAKSEDQIVNEWINDSEGPTQEEKDIALLNEDTTPPSLTENGVRFEYYSDYLTTSGSVRRKYLGILNSAEIRRLKLEYANDTRNPNKMKTRFSPEKILKDKMRVTEKGVYQKRAGGGRKPYKHLKSADNPTGNLKKAAARAIDSVKKETFFDDEIDKHQAKVERVVQNTEREIARAEAQARAEARAEGVRDRVYSKPPLRLNFGGKYPLLNGRWR